LHLYNKKKITLSSMERNAQAIGEASMLRVSISIALLCVFGALDAQAARLTNVTGTVFVNRGQGFQPVNGEMEVNPGDRINVVQGTADIVYDNGATVKVASGEMIAVLATPPDVLSGGPALADFSTSTYILGGLVVIGGLGAGLALSSHGSPASP
jgi:hypothetical protein